LVVKKIFVLSIFFVFLFSTGFCATVTDDSASTTNAQSLAQLNATLSQLVSQISALKAQDQNFQSEVMLKSDLETLYANVDAINYKSEARTVLDSVIIVILAFAVMFLLIGKNLLPQNKVEKTKVEPKKVVPETEIIVPEQQVIQEHGDDI